MNKFNFEDKWTWHKTYSKCLHQHFRDLYKDLYENKNQYAFSNMTPDQLYEFAQSFWTNFDHILAFHGCKVYEEESYHRNGIQPLKYERCETLLLEANTLLAEFEIQINSESISNIIEKYKSNTREGRVFLSIDKRLHSVDGATHYTLEGSEFLKVCLRELVGDEVATSVLSKFGRSCIVHCELSTNRFDLELLATLSYEILEYYIEIFVNSNSEHSVSTFTLDPSEVYPKEIFAFEYLN